MAVKPSSRLISLPPTNVCLFSPGYFGFPIHPLVGLEFCLSVGLSVVLWLDKGDFPENVHAVCPC